MRKVVLDDSCAKENNKNPVGDRLLCDQSMAGRHQDKAD